MFADFNQANRDRTIAGAYSPRALPHAPVSTPVTWEELGDVDPREFTVRTVPERLRSAGDPWAHMHDEPGSIATLLEWWERDLRDGLGELPFPGLPEDAGRATTGAAEPGPEGLIVQRRTRLRSYAAGTSSCSNVQERASLSGRHRSNWTVWRKRCPSMLS